MLKQILVAMLLAACVVPAEANGPLTVERINGYLVYEETGTMSKNVARSAERIEANTQAGFSVQMIVDVVVSGPKNELVEGSPLLFVWVVGADAQPGDPAMVDVGWPINYIGATGEIVRTIVVDHDCNGFEVHARVDGMPGSERMHRFDLACGD